MTNDPLFGVNPSASDALSDELMIIASDRFNPNFDIKRNTAKHKFGDPACGPMYSDGKAFGGKMEMYNWPIEMSVNFLRKPDNYVPFNYPDDGKLPAGVSPSIDTTSKFTPMISDKRMHGYFFGRDRKVDDYIYRQVRYRGDSGIYERDAKFVIDKEIPPKKVMVVASPEMEDIKNMVETINVEPTTTRAPLAFFIIASVLGFIFAHIISK